MYRDEKAWIQAYEEKNALWIHDGNMRRPHAKLTTGKHSNGFFNSRPLISDEQLLREAAHDLADRFVISNGNTDLVSRVVGPQTGGAKLAEYIADDIGCEWTALAKCGDGDTKKFVSDSGQIIYGDLILLCDDVLTSGKSIELVDELVTKQGGIIQPYILVLVNRSGLRMINGKEILSLIDRNMPTWFPEECPYCQKGSEAIRPKSVENWTRLNASY